jgi:hypothetical protein
MENGFLKQDRRYFAVHQDENKMEPPNSNYRIEKKSQERKIKLRIHDVL